MASVAVFVALGGGAYAAVHVNGKDIQDHTITGKKIKRNTLGSKQIKESRLGEVPRAARAKFATKAGSADTADSATSAKRATSAGTATTATLATTAETATTATNAANATNATNAANADNAATLGGDAPAAFLVSCPADTSLYGGVCWDNTSRAAATWFVASDTCGNAGGRLPTLSELVAYTDQGGVQVTGQHHTSEIVDMVGGTIPEFVTRDDSNLSFNFSASLAYRCVFYRSN
jgi:hypothetical protein